MSNEQEPAVRSQQRRRRRLSVQERRAELIALGLELFATQPYDDVWIEGVADRAGISRGLLYHYFPTKRDYYLAVMQAATEGIFSASTPSTGASPARAIRAGIDAFLAAVEAQPHGYLTAYRGTLSSDSEVRAVALRARARQTDRIVALLSPAGAPSPPLLRTAVHGWTAMAQDMTADWLQRGAPDADQLRDILFGALVGTIRAAGSPSLPIKVARV